MPPDEPPADPGDDLIGDGVGRPSPLLSGRRVLGAGPEQHHLVAGPRRALAVSAARVDGINWLAEDQIAVEAKVRSLARPVAARWEGAMLSFGSPEYGVAPGQSAVFYDGERLLGGGTIVATEAAALDEPAAA